MAFFFRFLGYVAVLAMIILGGVILGPGLPEEYDPFAPLDPLAEPGLLTGLKLDAATRSVETCLAVLEDIPDIRYARLLDRRISDQCHIQGHTRVRQLSQAYMTPMSTRCDTALRFYMWERHTLQPAAQLYLGSSVEEIGHFDSFSCRAIRTPDGPGTSMSAHATAQAIDISSVTLDNGRRLSVLAGWRGRDSRIRQFWRAARNGGCTYFKTVLSPDYNNLHADHFHFAQGRYGACR